MLAAGSAVATWLAADLVLLLVHGPVRSIENFHEPDPRFGYRMRPNLDFVFASPYHGYDAKVHTNSRGLRGPEIAVPKPAGVLRVLLLGDSMTAGLEVGERETFATVCAGQLRAQRPAEVVNAGVRGYELDNIVAYLRTEGLSLEPDIVVYFFTDNDLTNDTDPAPKQSDISRGFRIRGLTGRLATYSHLTYRLEVFRQRLALRRQRDHVHNPMQPARVFLPGGLVAFFTNRDYEGVPAYRLTAIRIETLAVLCRERGIPFVLAGAPQKEEIDPATQQKMAAQIGGGAIDFDGVNRYLDWVAGKLRIARFDPIPGFRQAVGGGQDFWFHNDNHLNPKGHRLLGGLLADWILAFAPPQAGRTPDSP